VQQRRQTAEEGEGDGRDRGALASTPLDAPGECALEGDVGAPDSDTLVSINNNNNNNDNNNNKTNKRLLVDDLVGLLVEKNVRKTEGLDLVGRVAAQNFSEGALEQLVIDLLFTSVVFDVFDPAATRKSVAHLGCFCCELAPGSVFVPQPCIIFSGECIDMVIGIERKDRHQPNSFARTTCVCLLYRCMRLSRFLADLSLAA
jgi:hypothetical protein